MFDATGFMSNSALHILKYMSRPCYKVCILKIVQRVKSMMTIKFSHI